MKPQFWSIKESELSVVSSLGWSWVALHVEDDWQVPGSPSAVKQLPFPWKRSSLNIKLENHCATIWDLKSVEKKNLDDGTTYRSPVVDRGPSRTSTRWHWANIKVTVSSFFILPLKENVLQIRRMTEWTVWTGNTNRWMRNCLGPEDLPWITSLERNNGLWIETDSSFSAELFFCRNPIGLSKKACGWEFFLSFWLLGKLVGNTPVFQDNWIASEAERSHTFGLMNNTLLDCTLN